MTIICAQKTKTGVVLGADNNTSDGNKLIRRAVPKLTRVSDRVVFGSSGHVRLADMLRDEVLSNRFPTPIRSNPIDIVGVERELGRFFRSFLKEEFRASEKGKLWTIVAVDDQIFDVGQDGAVIRIDGTFLATGNVEQLAIGALYVLNRAYRNELPTEEEAKALLQIAMESCAEFGECIRPPWTFMSTKRPE